MGIFNQWPYTNFHELNLDWIVKKIKKYEEAFNNLDKYIEEKLTDEKIEEVITDLVQRGIQTNNPFIRYGFCSSTKFELPSSTQHPNNQGATSDGTYFYSYREDKVNGGAGILNKYNMNGNLDSNITGWSLVNTASIDLSHGNNLFYNKVDGYIYATALQDNAGYPDKRVFKINKDTLALEQTIYLPYALWGLAYNSKLNKWAGWIQPDNKQVNPKRIAFFDDEFNLIEEIELPSFLTLSRVGMYGDDEYLYLLSTGALSYPQVNPAQTFYNKIDIFDWSGQSINTVYLNNIEELEALVWTGKAFVCTFNGIPQMETKDYASFVQIRNNDYVPAAFYNYLWGNNQLVFNAETEEELFMELNTDLPWLENRALYGATHLEIDFTENIETATVTATLPRAYCTTDYNQWVSVMLVRTSGNYMASFRIRQEPSNYNFRITGAVCYKLNRDGSIEYTTGDNVPVKIRRIRACNYTQQRLNSFLK